MPNGVLKSFLLPGSNPCESWIQFTMTNPLLPEGDPSESEAAFRHRALLAVRDESSGGRTLTHELSTGPRAAGVDLIVLAAKGSLVYLRSLISKRQGVRTLIAVPPTHPADARTDDVHEYVKLLVQPLHDTFVQVIVGHSAAAYLAASIAEAQAAQQIRPPKLVFLEPLLPGELMSSALSDLLLIPEAVLQRFTTSLSPDSLPTAPRGTAEFRRQLVDMFLTHRAEFASALRSADPAHLLAPPRLALNIYPEWAGWLSLCMQLCTVTYRGPVECIEGVHSAKMEAPERARRFARIRNSFPQVRFQETNAEHGELLHESILLPHFTTQA